MGFETAMMAQARVPRPIRVVIVDDTEDLRFLLRTALTRAGMEVVAEAPDGRLGIDAVRETQPDVVLLDLAMPVMDGRAALPQIRREAPAARIIVRVPEARRTRVGQVQLDVVHAGRDHQRTIGRVFLLL